MKTQQGISKSDPQTLHTATLWQQVLDHMRDAMILLDNNGRVIRINTAAAALHIEQGKGICEAFCGPVLGAPCQDQHGSSGLHCPIARNQYASQEIYAESTNKWYRIHTHPLSSNGDHPEKALLVLEDVTQQHVQEVARNMRLFHFQSMQHINLVIAESRGTQKTLLNLLSAIKVIFKADRACLLTPDAKKPCSWHVPIASSSESLEGVPFDSIEVSPEMDNTFKAALTAAQPTMIKTEDIAEFAKKYHVQTQLVFTIHSKLGKPWLIALQRIDPEKPWSDNKCLVLAAIADRITDVLDAWQLNETLERRTDQYKQLVENMPDGVLILQDQHITFANQVMQDMMATNSEDDFQGKSIDSFIHPDYVAKMHYRFEAALQGKRNPIQEIKLLALDGAVLDVISSSMAVSYTGKPAVQIIMRDVTKRNLLDKALRESMEKNKKMARQIINVQEQERVAIAQDLHDDSGQLLTAMSMNLQSIKGHIQEEKLKARLEDTENMVQQLFTSIRSSLETLNPTHIDVLGLGDAIRSELDTWAIRYGVTLDIDIAEEVSFPCSETATAIFRVIQEAFTNIAKYAEATHVYLCLKLIVSHPSFIDLTITDNGKGFDIKQLSETSGFGVLGMHARTEMVSGVISIVSNVDEGTTIHAAFPLNPAAQLSTKELTHHDQ